MASILVHTCCAPCSTYTVEFWREQRHQISGYWSNPNIHPFDEHRLRLQNMEDYARGIALSLIVAPGYHPEDYFQAVAGHEAQAERCQYCYLLRLSQAATVARKAGFDAFTTTLLISPYQDHELLKQIGEQTQLKAGIRFLYQDLRQGYRRSREMAREAGLYRQRYCGCRYSEGEVRSQRSEVRGSPSERHEFNARRRAPRCNENQCLTGAEACAIRRQCLRLGLRVSLQARKDDHRG